MRPHSRSSDLFVIGGGPAGLATAIAARRRGLTVTVADSGRPPIDKSCGEGIMPDGVAAAQALGIALDRAPTQPFRGIRFREGDLTAEAPFPRGHGLGLRRTVLHQLLLDRATELGVRMLWGARIAGLDELRARWVVGADGGASRVRQWAGLDACGRERRRFGFRRHYAGEPWSDFVEILWGDRFQLYVTPVDEREICVALICGDPRLRIDDAVARFPHLARRLGQPSGAVRGGISASRRLDAVWGGRVALVGDASGSVDAIAGEGLCLAFRQAEALASALEAGDLSLYAEAHRRFARRPRMIAELLLLLGQWRTPRRAAVRVFAAYPRWFERLLALHVGEPSHDPLRADGNKVPDESLQAIDI